MAVHRFDGLDRSESSHPPYSPAFQFGNQRDIDLIVRSSGRSEEEVRESMGLTAQDYVPEDWQNPGDKEG